MMETGKKGMSKREKILVFGGGTIGLFILMFMYVITPLNEDIEAKTAEQERLEMQWRIIETKLANEENIRAALDESFEQYYEIRDSYIPESHNNEIGREMTFFIRGHDFWEINQNISGIANFTEGDITGDPVFSVLPVTMDIGGGYDELKRLLDTVVVSPYYRVSTFAVSGSEGIQVETVPVGFRVIMFKSDKVEEDLRMIRYVEDEEET